MKKINIAFKKCNFFPAAVRAAGIEITGKFFHSINYCGIVKGKRIETGLVKAMGRAVGESFHLDPADPLLQEKKALPHGWWQPWDRGYPA